jgi:hypothetical protein
MIFVFKLNFKNFYNKKIDFDQISWNNIVTIRIDIF